MITKERLDKYVYEEGDVELDLLQCATCTQKQPAKRCKTFGEVPIVIWTRAHKCTHYEPIKGL